MIKENEVHEIKGMWFKVVKVSTDRVQRAKKLELIEVLEPKDEKVVDI